MNDSNNNFAYKRLKFVRGSENCEDGNMPLLSVVVCAYRHADYIEECLERISAAACPDIELLVIDDGSPDGTLNRCIQFPFNEGLSFRVFTKPNGGVVESLRIGLELARGRYVAFMASDDMYTDTSLKSVLALLRSNRSKLDALLCQAVCFGEEFEDRPVYGSGIKKFFDATNQDRVRIICTEFPRPMLLQASIFNIQFLRSIDPWNDDLELDDWPTFVRVFLAEAERGAVIRYMPELTLCRYRVHKKGIHNQTDHMLRVTEQVAMQLVPGRYRAICLANVRIDCGFIHLYEGRWCKGLMLWFRGLSSSTSWAVIGRLLDRAGRWTFVAVRKFLHSLVKG